MVFLHGLDAKKIDGFKTKLMDLCQIIVLPLKSLI
jgi:hypothetical protein